jgi:hypothetical protein
METVGGLFCSLKNFLSQGFRSLPVILGGSLLILGLTQGNFNFLFFFVGVMILAPTAAFLFNGLLELVIPKGWHEIFFMGNGTAEQCSIFTVFPPNGAPTAINTVPSFWMTSMAFFFSYLFFNALKLYNKQSSSKAPQAAVNARKSQAMTSMLIIVAVGILFTILRYAKFCCETGLSMFISWGLGIGLAYGWYEFMRACGLGRLDDIFGINNRILPLQSYEDNTPMTCVPTG